MRRYLLNFFLVLLPLSLSAANEPVEAELTSQVSEIRAATPFLVGLRLAMAPGWHTYGEDPGLVGMPTEIAWELPEGFEVGQVRWPTPVVFETAGIESRGYEDEVLLQIEIRPPAQFGDVSEVTLKGHASWVACGTECIPGEQDVQLTLAIDREPATAGVPAFDIASDEPSGLLTALFFAFLGGMLLNLMPCVLPVISVKILGFVQIAGNDRAKILLHSVVYTLGILLCFWTLATLLLVLQSAGSAVGWGFHLQSPGFVAVLIGILFTLGMNLFGVMEITLPFVPSTGVSRDHSPLLSSFSTGLLTTLVATPCTGPFLGPVLGYAVTLPAWGALAIFTSMGLGLASPYLLLSAFPALLKYLPKPGTWMIHFKQAMGFLMMGSVIWLLWVFEAQTGTDSLFVLLLALLTLSLAFWVHGSFRAPILKKADRSWLAAFSFVFLLSAAVWLIYGTLATQETGSVQARSTQWTPFSPERFAELRAEGKPVFIDFTAKWCAICQVNKTTLHSSSVAAAFHERGIVPMQADWTKQDPVITEWLKKFGRSGVPLYVLYGPEADAQPQILPTTLTPDLVLKHLTEVKQTSAH